MKDSPKITIDDVRAAARRIEGHVVRTPLVRLNVDDAPAEAYLKLENLQPSGAFKLRGAMNAMLSADPNDLARGVWTASSGNMAVAVSFAARKMGVPCVVLVSDSAPRAKLEAIEHLGAKTIKISWAKVLEVCNTGEYPGMQGVFLHPFSDPIVMAGNATVGLEIVEDLPDVDAVTIPYGGGGFAAGVASAVKALRPGARCLAAEVDTGAPFDVAIRAGKPVAIDQKTSWVSGIGAPFIFEDMWPLVSKLLDGSVVSSLPEVASAIRVIAEHNHVVAEGAGAASVAPVLAGRAGTGKIACIISGGNIDMDKLATILQGGVP